MEERREARLQSLDSTTVIDLGREAASGPARVPALTILAHPDVDRVGDRAVLPALASRWAVEVSRLVPAFAPVAAPGPRRPLGDSRLSRSPLTLVPADGGLCFRRGSYAGPLVVDGKALGTDARITPAALEGGVTLELGSRVALLVHQVLPIVGRPTTSFGMVGESDAMADLRHSIARVADTAVSVLVTGPTGSGKELVVRALHAASGRQRGPLVVVNMAAIPAALASAELFGAMRGAFTGADRRRTGYFSRANAGTLFLDEVGETPAEVQPLLLRALESGEIQPVGADRVERVDVRLIAATDADLDAAANAGSFRAPLLHRLRGWPLVVPPLSARRDDIARLLLFFLRQELQLLDRAHRLVDPGPRGEPWLPARLVAHLVRGAWPGNVRQLRQIACQMAIEGRDRPRAALDATVLARIDPPAGEPPPRALFGASRSGASAAKGDATAEPARSRLTAARRYRRARDVGTDELITVLRHHRWRLRPAAAELGVSRTTLYALIDRCSAIRKAADIGRREIEQTLAEHGGDLDAVAARLEVSRHGLLLRVRELGLATHR